MFADEDPQTVCTLPSDEGDYCTGWELFWFYDKEIKRCRMFYYGGCSGNGNRFESEQACEKVCMATEPTEPVEPTEPTEWEEEVEPTQPVEPVEPTESTVTDEPEEPVEPVEPTEAADGIVHDWVFNFNSAKQLLYYLGLNNLLMFLEKSSVSKPPKVTSCVEIITCHVQQHFDSLRSWENTTVIIQYRPSVKLYLAWMRQMPIIMSNAHPLQQQIVLGSWSQSAEAPSIEWSRLQLTK